MSSIVSDVCRPPLTGRAEEYDQLTRVVVDWETYPEATEQQMHTPLTIESDFYRLAQQWERERPHGADVLEMVMHPSHQRIIGMGPDVVPLLLKELERKPGHWFWALHAITGANPVLPENQGNLKEMAKAWIDWGKKQGYSW